MFLNFEISAPNETSQFISILQPCLERSNAHLTVVTDCTVSITARSKRKDGDLWKRRGDRITFNWCWEICVGDHWTVCPKCRPWPLCGKIHAIDRYKHPYGLVLVGNKIYFCSWLPCFTLNRNVALYVLLFGCHMIFLCIVLEKPFCFMFVRMYQRGFNWRDFHAILY